VAGQQCANPFGKGEALHDRFEVKASSQPGSGRQ